MRSTTALASPSRSRARPGAEQRVDHQGRAVKSDRGCREGLARVPRGGFGRIAMNRPARAQEAEVDHKSALSEKPRRDEAVAAVVAGSAENDDPAARAREARRFVRDREPRRLHQDGARRPAGDRDPIGLPHLGRRQEFQASFMIEHAPKVALRGDGGKSKKGLRKTAWRCEKICYMGALLIPDSSAGRAFDC